MFSWYFNFNVNIFEFNKFSNIYATESKGSFFSSLLPNDFIFNWRIVIINQSA